MSLALAWWGWLVVVPLVLIPWALGAGVILVTVGRVIAWNRRADLDE